MNKKKVINFETKKKEKEENLKTPIEKLIEKSNITKNETQDEYDVFFDSLQKGKLKDLISEELKTDKEIINLADKYMNLIFYEGTSEYWHASVEGENKDFKEIANGVLNNYIFLTRLAELGGERPLKELSKYEELPDYAEYTVIERLRNTFANDKLLIVLLLNISKENSEYNIFNTIQKSLLLDFPTGTLYFYSDKGIKLTPPYLLREEIVRRYYKDEENITDTDKEEIDKIAQDLFETLYGKDPEIIRELEYSSFLEIVMKMQSDYQNSTGKKTPTMLDYIDTINGKEVEDFWYLHKNIKTPFEDTPYEPNNTHRKK